MRKFKCIAIMVGAAFFAVSFLGFAAPQGAQAEDITRITVGGSGPGVCR